MSALATRILWLLAETPTASSAAISQHFAGYTTAHVDRAIELLRSHHLVEHVDPFPHYATPIRLTDAGRVAAALPIPPRWSAPRRPVAQPHTATIAR